MKKSILAVFVAIAMVAGVGGVVFAAQNVANVSQKGSLLVFPKIDISEGKDTLVSISNDYYRPVAVKCIWVDADQEIADFVFEITKNQPVCFSAATGEGTVDVPPFDGPVGELKCFAVNDNADQQISWNHLYGTAKVIDFLDETAYEYNSWNFIARGVKRGNPVGNAGDLILSGNRGEYDGCPSYLLFNFRSVGSSVESVGVVDFNDTDLTVALCKEDLTQDREPTHTKLKFDIWDENEVKYTGAWVCAKCWFEDLLSNISDKFIITSACGDFHTNCGRFRVKGIASSVCPGSEATGLVGLSAELMTIINGDEGSPAAAACTANGAGKSTNGYVLWDPQEEPPEMITR